MAEPTAQQMLIDILEDEYSLTGLKAPEDAELWTEDQIQRYFDSGGKRRPNPEQIAAAAEERERAEQEAVASEVARQTPFGVLGLARSCSLSEVKKAYKVLALRFHPDRNLGPSQDEAARRFQRVAEAYELLSDPTRRNTYERDGAGWAPEGSMRYKQAHDLFEQECGAVHGDGWSKQVDSDWWTRFDSRHDHV